MSTMLESIRSIPKILKKKSWEYTEETQEEEELLEETQEEEKLQENTRFLMVQIL